MNKLFWMAAFLVAGVVIVWAGKRWLSDPEFMRGWG